MDTKKLNYLIRLYEDGNITHTAREMFITQSALTKMIQGWEKEFHCSLLTRSKKGVRFTQEGELFVQLCKNILQEEEEFQEKISHSEKVVAGSLSVGVSLNYMDTFFPDILKHFIHEYPHVQLSITDAHSEKLYQQLLNRQLDIAIVRGEYKWTDTKLLLASEPLCLISTQPLTEKTLVSEPYIGHRTDTDTKFSIDQWFFEHHMSVPQAAMWLESINACREVVQAGIGWAILPQICLSGFKGNCKPLFFKDGTPFQRRTYALVSHGQPMLPQVKAFLDTLKNFRQ
jgi:DNA-binding transcriptional LysR family regulator